MPSPSRIARMSEEDDEEAERLSYRRFLLQYSLLHFEVESRSEQLLTLRSRNSKTFLSRASSQSAAVARGTARHQGSEANTK